MKIFNHRYLYEVAPVAFLVEAAGGKSSDGNKSLLDVLITSLDQTSVLYCGSNEEVDRVEENIMTFKS